MSELLVVATLGVDVDGKRLAVWSGRFGAVVSVDRILSDAIEVDADEIFGGVGAFPTHKLGAPIAMFGAGVISGELADEILAAGDVGVGILSWGRSSLEADRGGSVGFGIESEVEIERAGDDRGIVEGRRG